MTRVLEVIYGFHYGGIRAFIMNYLTYLDKEEFSVDIYAFGCDSSPFTSQVEELGARIFFEPENNVRNIPKFVGQLKRFMIEQGPYDVVHAHNNLISAWVLLAAKLAHVPVRLAHSHTASHFEHSLAQNLYSYMRRWMIHCLATRKLACGQLAGKVMYGNKARFEVVTNGISLERFMHREEARICALRRQLNIPEGVKVYANVTRMDSNKNHVFALEVFHEILKTEPDSVFVYGGVIPDIDSSVDAIKQTIAKYGLERNCRFTGPLMDIEQLYHLSDVWIYCSFYEGLPFGPLELQATATPVLVSDAITREVDLGLGLVHFLSLNQSPADWARLAVSLRKQSLPSEQVTAAFQKYHFDIQQNVKALQQLYLRN